MLVTETVLWYNGSMKFKTTWKLHYKTNINKLWAYLYSKMNSHLCHIDLVL